MIAVGLSSSILGCLVTLLVYSYCQRYQQQSHDATVIHPITAAPLNTSITNHINKLDKYDTVEAIKVGGPGFALAFARFGGDFSGNVRTRGFVASFQRFINQPVTRSRCEPRFASSSGVSCD